MNAAPTPHTRRAIEHPSGTLKRGRAVALAAATICALAHPVRAETPLASRLAGHTLSAVVYRSRSPGPVTGHSLHRLMLQAYLEPGGRALFRDWSSSRDRYTVPAPGRWSLAGSQLCLSMPSETICANVHVWGPRIAGIGIQPYAMLDGDLQPGNAISARQQVTQP